MQTVFCDNCEAKCNLSHILVQLVVEHPSLQDDLEERHFCTRSCLTNYFSGKIGPKGL